MRATRALSLSFLPSLPLPPSPSPPLPPPSTSPHSLSNTPPLQPRRFDEEPYVELPFDRRMPLYSDNDPTYKMDLQTTGTHIFGGNIWPPPKVEKVKNVTDYFDPTKTYYQNYCDMIEAEVDVTHDPYNPLPSHVAAPKCTLCNKRYMSLTCLQCCASYCVQCSNHVHGKKAKAHHNVTQYKHVYVKPAREVGIVPHLTAASVISKKMLALTEVAQNGAELKKIEDNKKLERDMEGQAIADLNKVKEAAAQKQELHDAANVVQDFFARSAKRAQLNRNLDELRRAVVGHSLKDQIEQKEALKIQKVFRGFSVRFYFTKQTVDVVTEEKDGTKTTEKRSISTIEYPTILVNGMNRPLPSCLQIAAARVTIDFDNRRSFQRNAQIGMMEVLKKTIATKSYEEVAWCNLEMEVMEIKLQKLESMMGLIVGKEDIQRKLMSTMDVKGSAYLPESVKMKVFNAAHSHNFILQENIRTCLRWLSSHLRQTVRTAVQSQVQSGFVAKHLAWIDKEQVVMKKLVKFCRVRYKTEVAKSEKLKDDGGDENENMYYRQWLEEQQKRITDRLIAYDTEQESVLEATLFRLDNEQHAGGDDRRTVMEILITLERFRQYDAEKVGSEIKRVQAPPDSDESLLHLGREAALKKKEQKLQEETLPRLTQVLNFSHETEDKVTSQVVVFKKDEEGLSRQAMSQIQAVLKDPPKERKKFDEDKWMDMFRSQPWLTRQNTEEGRLSDIRRSRRRELDTKAKFLDGQRKEIEKTNQKVRDEEARILEYLAKANGTWMELDEKTGKPKKKQPEPLSELEKKDFQKAADDLREEIDEDAVPKQRREERALKEEEEQATSIKVMDEDEKAANERLARQTETIEEFKLSELAEDEVVLKRLREEREKLDKEEELLKKEAIVGEKKGGGEEVDVEEMVLLAKGREEWQEKMDALVGEEDKMKAMMERREQFYTQAREEAEEEMRRQRLKALQEDIRERKKYVLKAAKELEAQVAEESKALEAEEEAKRLANWQADQADEDIASLGVAGMSSKGRKKATLGSMIKGYVRKKAGTRDDPEQLQMISTIKKRMKIKGGQVEAIRFMKFTVGSEESDKFTAKQAKLQADGMPFFRRVSREIGLHDQIVIWIEKTVDQEEFLTDIEVAHTDQDHDAYINLREEGWDRSGHDRMMGVGTNDPQFCVWMFRNEKKMPIGDINLSYSMADEEELEREGFEIIETNLNVFGFGDMNLWVRRLERASVPVFVNSAHVAKELMEARKVSRTERSDRGRDPPLAPLKTRSLALIAHLPAPTRPL